MSGLALGVARHNGWAWFVTVAGSGEDFEVVDRRRVMLIDADQPRQPYHHEALRVSPREAERLLGAVRASVHRNSAVALRDTLRDLAPRGGVALLAIDGPPHRALPERLADILASHQLVHTADGEMYRSLLIEEAVALGLGVYETPRGKVLQAAAAALGSTAAEVEALTGALGAPHGPPWRKEHREAAAAAITALRVAG